jgi:hypothetical protein
MAALRASAPPAYATRINARRAGGAVRERHASARLEVGVRQDLRASQRMSARPCCLQVQTRPRERQIGAPLSLLTQFAGRRVSSAGDVRPLGDICRGTSWLKPKQNFNQKRLTAKIKRRRAFFSGAANQPEYLISYIRPAVKNKIESDKNSITCAAKTAALAAAV